MRKVQTAALTAASLLVFGGYYGLGDALDLVPGPVTVAYADVAPQPFPTPAGPSAKTSTPAGLETGAPKPSKAALTSYVQAVASDAALAGGGVTASVVDVATGEELLDQHAATGVTPASTNKLLTAWAALSSMGPGHTLQTKTVLDGQTLTLVGGGDVLLAEDAGDPTATVGHAGLGDLARATAEQLKASGVGTGKRAMRGSWPRSSRSWWTLNPPRRRSTAGRGQVIPTIRRCTRPRSSPST